MKINDIVYSVPETYNYKIKDREIIKWKIVEIKKQSAEYIENWELKVSNYDTYKIEALEDNKVKSQEFWLYACKEEFIFKNGQDAIKYLQEVNSQREITREEDEENIKKTFKYVLDICKNIERYIGSKDTWINTYISHPRLKITIWNEKQEFWIENLYDM